MDQQNENPGKRNPHAEKYEDDQKLINDFIEGDESAFRKLVMKHKDKVRNLIYVTTNNRDAIDDIAQDVFITVFNKIRDFRFESQFTTWLYRVTINKCKDSLRKVKIRSIFQPINENDDFSSGSLSHREVDVNELVQQAIERLPEKLKTPLIMREIDGLSYKEIADALECEVGTIKSRIFRARESLKILLQPYEKELFT